MTFKELQATERYWVAGFSQTGSEIVEVAQSLFRWPDLIISVSFNLEGINKTLDEAFDTGLTNYHTLGAKPNADTYRELIPPGSLVTLHGYLKIVPPEICDEYYILNGHPGLITEYPQLKGKDPQKKALELKLKSTGCVIHEVTSQVDGGKILVEEPCPIFHDDTLEVLTNELHQISVRLWIETLRPLLYVNKILTQTI